MLDFGGQALVAQHGLNLRLAYGFFKLDRPQQRHGGHGNQSGLDGRQPASGRSEEHTSELQSLMRISYAVFCLKKKKKNQQITNKIKKYHNTVSYMANINT